jgi:hypothetical protein
MSRCFSRALVTLSLVLAPSVTHGAVTGWTDVVVRVYDANGVLGGTNRAALDHARKTLEAASVDVTWRLCGPSPCDAPMAPGELAIRIVRSALPQRYQGTVPLGDALVDRNTGVGVLATIYFDRVLWLAARADADSRVLLGSAIAHELGHLLLATTTHGPVGLMRAHWSQEEVRRGQPRDWSFAATELAAMRRRAEARERDARLTWGTR